LRTQIRFTAPLENGTQVDPPVFCAKLLNNQQPVEDFQDHAVIFGTRPG